MVVAVSDFVCIIMLMISRGGVVLQNTLRKPIFFGGVAK